MIYIGIDPGQSGAIAIISETNTAVEKMQVQKQGLLKNRVSGKSLRELFSFVSKKGPVTIIAEEQGVRAITAKKAAFAMGINYAILLESLEYASQLGCRVIMVKPQQWKKTLGVIGKSSIDKKHATIDLVKRIFPDVNINKPRSGVDDNKADALALAEYGRIKY